jgi:hypothetical protein
MQTTKPRASSLRIVSKRRPRWRSRILRSQPTTGPRLCSNKQLNKIAFTERYELLSHLLELRVKKYARQNPQNISENSFINHDITIFFLSLVPYPKPIKLGPKGSSTKLWGSVNSSLGQAKHELFRNSIIYRLKNFQKIIIFEKSKINAKLSARAPEGAGNCHKNFPINIGKKNLKIYQKNFVPNFKMPIAKYALRSTIGRLNQKLGPRKHISTFLEGKFKKSRENDCTNSRSRSSSSISIRILNNKTKIKSL